MTDYIDRDAALTLDFRIQTRLFERRIETAKRAVEAYAVKIAAIPIADVAPVVHGRWKKAGSIESWAVFKCSACGAQTVDNGRYCPSCGARMEAAP